MSRSRGSGLGGGPSGPIGLNPIAQPDPAVNGAPPTHPFPGSQWTTPLPASPVIAANSAALVSNWNAQWATPYNDIDIAKGPARYVVDGRTFAWTTMNVNPGQRWSTYNPTGSISVPIPPGFAPSGVGDSQTIIWDVGNKTLWEFWVTGPQNADGSWTCNTMNFGPTDGTFAGVYPWSGDTSGLQSSCAASRMSYAGGEITRADLLSGSIEHAIALTAANAGAFVPPATQNDGTFNNSIGTASSSLPEGTLLFFPANVTMPSGLPTIAQMIFKALQRYGGYVIDITQGYGCDVDVETDVTWLNYDGGVAPPIPINWNITYGYLNNLPWSQLAAAAPVTAFTGGVWPAPPTAPGLSVVAANTAVVLNWTLPGAYGTGTYVGMEVYEGTASGQQLPVTIASTTGTGTSLSVTGLTNGTTYYFKIAAKTTACVGTASVEVSATPAVVSLATGTAIPLVQQADTTTFTGTAASVSLPSAVTSGDALIVLASVYENGNSVTSVTGGGGTWVEAGTATLTTVGGNGTVSIWYNLSPSAAIPTVSVNFSAAPSGQVNLVEFGHITGVDQLCTEETSNPNWTSPTLVPTHTQNELFINLGSYQNRGSPSNWTLFGGFTSSSYTLGSYTNGAGTSTAQTAAGSASGGQATVAVSFY